MQYVALLRGINVGGKTKVEMSRLKLLFETLNCRRVRTYINSGNVLFEDDRTATDLTPIIEVALAKTFGLPIPVVLRDFAAIRDICRDVPASWANDTAQKTDVLFLWDEINDKSIFTKVKINPAIERVRYVGGALVWNIGRENVTRGGGIKLIGTDVYRHLTARNINTVRKLYELMQA